MLDRAGEGLTHLRGVVRARIVGQTLILPGHEGELGLQEQLVALHEAGGEGSRNRGADAGLVVVTALVRRVDAAEAGLEGQPRRALGVRFLPGRAVDEAGHAPARDGKVARDLVRMIQGCLFLCRCVSIARAVRRVTVDRENRRRAPPAARAP